MSKILYYSESDKNISSFDDLIIEKKNNLRDSILFFLNNYDTAGFIFDIRNSDEENKKILLLIDKFNPAIPVIILNENEIRDKEIYKRWNKNIFWIKNLNEVSSVFKPFENKRKFYRINWPLNIVFSESFEMKNALKGKILTISLGGAYVLSEDIKNLNKDHKLICRIEFSIFHFLVESKIARLNAVNSYDSPIGFAVQFENITDATRKCINRTINDEVISTLSNELNFPIH